jgi:BirA family biotin operon repressor/biotin-[acetyl-CoA-carboxylase] ligase
MISSEKVNDYSKTSKTSYSYISSRFSAVLLRKESMSDWIIHTFESLPSTQRALKKDLLDNKISPFTIYVTTNQTNGHGRGSRNWEAPFGNLSFSFVLPIEHKSISDFISLPLVMGYSLHQVISSEFHIESQIKWPNDILIHEKKVAGVLMEIFPEKKMVLVGIGFNLNSTKSDFSPALQDKITTIRDELNHKIEDSDDVLEKLLRQIKMNYETFLSDGFSSFHEKIENLMWRLHSRIQIENKEYEFLGLSEMGALLVKDGDETKEIVSGEIET